MSDKFSDRYADSIAAQLRKQQWHSAADCVVQLADSCEALAAERDKFEDEVVALRTALRGLYDATWLSPGQAFISEPGAAVALIEARENAARVLGGGNEQAPTLVAYGCDDATALAGLADTQSDQK